ncbi:hypothetical protein SY86_15690 [Erwinia tracheiphila]|uniref:Uncharacterized protein n=1 Tax=Erwinia tracheiphila TaxID=65700 RepID=A0A0M2KGU8_9GAMM|nr:hypothetical protein SY86_15690 [Erwinia tracheiphila]
MYLQNTPKFVSHIDKGQIMLRSYRAYIPARLGEDISATSVNIAAYLDCVGWALLLAGVGCWFAGWIAVMGIIFVVGVLFLLVGSSL